jgi:pyruvate-formate lyase-activating enzyme
LKGVDSWEMSPETHKVMIGGGILIVFTSGERQLVVELVHRDENKDGFQTLGECVIRYYGSDSLRQDTSTPEAHWLQEVCANVHAIDSVDREEWESYLKWASRQPKRGFSRKEDKRMTHGQELLIRLLEPCQARCSFCSCRDAQPDMVSSAEDIEERLQEGIENGYLHVVFTGGEPTLVKDLPMILQQARDLGYQKIGLQTNGINIANMDYARLLVDSGLNYVLQSFHSHRAEVHESIYEIEGCFPQCMQSVKNLMELGVNVGLNHVATRRNSTGHREFIEFVEENFPRPKRLQYFFRGPFPTVTFSSMAPRGWGEQNKQDLPRLKDVAQSIEGAFAYAESKGIQIRIPGLCGFPPCFLPDQLRYFDEIREAEVLELDTRVHVEQCDRCAFKSNCSGYWEGYFATHGSDEFVPALAEDGYSLPEHRGPSHRDPGWLRFHLKGWWALLQG